MCEKFTLPMAMQFQKSNTKANDPKFVYGGIMDKDKIVTCGLTEKESQLVNRALWDESIEIFQEKTLMDSLMKHRVFALVLNLDSSTPADREFLQGYYEEMIWFSETIVITGEISPDWAVTGQVIYSRDLRKMTPDLRKVLQVAYTKTRNNENFRQGLVRAFQLAREIRNRPGVTTQRLSQDFSLSQDLTLWYITLLQSALEPIDYCLETGGWCYLTDGEPGSMEQVIQSVLSEQAMRSELDGWIKYEDQSVQIVERIKSDLKKI